MENLSFWLIIVFQFLVIVLLAKYSWQMRELAKRDFLTGLFNRNVLSETLYDFFNAEKGVRNFAVLMIDVDNFKLINDQMGHVLGDRVLKSVSSRIMGNIRPCDMAFRYGGEEFVVVLPEIDKRGAAEVSKRLLGKMRKNYRLEKMSSGELNLKVTVSMGLTLSRKDDTPLSVIERADKALYKAKDSGRDRIVFD